jgi:L-lactate dehydrogenase complex protein LldE
MKIQLFVPCFIDQFYPETAFNAIKIFEKLGLSVIYNPQQTCCGQPSFNSGYWSESKELAIKFLKDFNPDNPIVGLSASCTGYIRNYYPLLFENNSDKNRLNNILPQVYEFSDFLVNKLQISNLNSEFNYKVTYHDACSALREYGIKDEPRTLLKQVKGLELIEMEENEVCCGFGGTFSVKHPSISVAMTRQKVENAIQSGANVIVSTEASCLMSIEGYIRKNKINMKTMHIADVLASGI